jgi:hypothetical protein
MLMAVPISTDAAHRLDLGTPAPLFSARLAKGSNITGRAQYAVTRDGRFVLNLDANPDTSPPITVILNWSGLLKRGA